MRMTLPGTFQSAGYPPDIVPELAALRSPNRVFDADYAEQVAARLAFTQAFAAAENLGDLPMAVLWASQTYSVMENNPGLRGLPGALANYSTRSVTQTIEGADHLSILGSEQYA